MNVLLASDDNYAPLLGVTIYSLLENNKKDFNKINIFILDGGISEKNKNKIDKICDGFNIETPLEFIKYDNLEEILDIPIKATRALTAYARLFAGSLLKKDINKILYLDCDALVVNSFINLWQMDLEDNYCGAVLDAGPTYINTFLDLPENNNHYNSGLLLINLKLWKKDNLEKKFIDFIISKNGKVFHNDQGIINVICKGKIQKLHPKYNILSPFFEVGYDNVLRFYGISKYYTKELVEEALKEPVFIHLTTFVNGRPWFNNASKHPLRKIFNYYVEKTPFKNEVYKDDNRQLKGKFFSLSYKYLPYSFVCKMFSIYRHMLIKKHE